MKFNKAIVAMILAIAMIMGLASVAMAEDEPLKIGVIGPFTGGAAIYGLACQYGAQVAADEINALGGMQIQLLCEDDQHDAETSKNAYNKVLEDGAQMIAGTTTTKPCIEVGAIANEERVFMLTPSASSEDVINGKDNVFQVCFTDPNQGKASAQFIAEHQLATKIAIIYNNADPYSTGIYQTFIEKAAELNLEVVNVGTFTDETVDFSVPVSDAKEAGAELVFLPIYYQPASLILAKAKEMDYAPVFFGVDGMDGILTLEGFDTSLAEGVFLLTPFAADADDERTKTFVASYKELTGEVPNQFAADAYDAVYALVAAAEVAGITSDMTSDQVCELIIPAMQQITVEGVTGTMTWSASGEVTKTPTAVVIKDGVYVGFSK